LQVGFSTLCAKKAVSQPALMIKYWFPLLYNHSHGKRKPATQLLGQLQDTQPALIACMLSLCTTDSHTHISIQCSEVFLTDPIGLPLRNRTQHRDTPWSHRCQCAHLCATSQHQNICLDGCCDGQHLNARCDISGKNCTSLPSSEL